MRTRTRLRDYEITGQIGEGGFAIVYLAWDHSLQRRVAIKEYMPASLAARAADSATVEVRSERLVDTFKAGLRSFVNEARLLARFDHPSLVKVYRFWEENGTAYMAMPFHEGPTLQKALAELGHVPSEGELRTWLRPVLNALSVLHEDQTWHLDIGPDSILFTPVGPVLLGFAAARHAVAAQMHQPASALKAGFAAIEQYGAEAGSTRGAWTDLYALAAVIYTAITGTEPAAAADRLTQDRVRPLSIVAAGLYSESFLQAIDSAMAVQPEHRPQDHLQFRALMHDMDAPETPVSLAPPRDLMHEPFLHTEPGPAEITVPDPPVVAPAATPAKAAAPAAAHAGRATGSGEPEPVARDTPSWMRAGMARGAFGKRAAYGLIALTFALIGIAALTLQYLGRQAARPALATAAPGVVPTRPALPESPAAPAPTATAALPVQAATGPGLPVPAPAARTAPAAAPAPAPVPAQTAARTPPALVDAVASRSSPAPLPTAAVPRPSAALAAAPPDRPARCTDILQKASLEQITPAETEFYKRECK